MRRSLSLLAIAVAGTVAIVAAVLALSPGASGRQPIEPIAGLATSESRQVAEPTPAIVEPSTTLAPGGAASPAVSTTQAPQVAVSPDGEGPRAEDVYPVRISIGGIEVDAPLIDLGVNGDGTLEVPTDFDVAGWYTGRSVPGDLGPGVVVGHVDSRTGPAVFYEIRNLQAGDLIKVERSDGLDAWFAVRELVLVDKDEFPTESVYGDTSGPTLRLITCGGSFDDEARSYRGNLIVFAEHVGNYSSDEILAGAA